MTTAAVILSGCGFLDGSEIHETVSLLMALSQAGVSTDCFAPDRDAQVVDHLTGQPDGTSRNILTESARIARGQVRPISECDPSAFDALFFPGGFGAAKHLCDFAEKGSSCEVDSDVERVLGAFYDAGKPIGLCCIAPVLAAKVFANDVTITLGGASDASRAAQSMGANHVEAPANQAVVDQNHHIATAPAYMCDAPLHEVAQGISEMVRQTLAMIPQRA
ncbi:MAG: isoprenoid biosynthesis glyoxalase ElbB [Planctomycetota bacterium]|jgi:enhancing lycopene biosynthesis protein 2